MFLEVKNLSKTYGKRTTVDRVSLNAGENEFVGLLGPNGAGKSTIIHMILGLVTPTSGEVFIFDKPFTKHREELLQKMNFTAPYVAYPPRLTVWENLMIFAKLYGVKNAAAKVSEMLKLFEIERLRNKPVSALSSGENTLVGLSKTFINEPKLLLLDEPTAFLDPQVALQVKEVLLDLKKRLGITVFYTSHNMAEVEQMCSRIYFLSHGQVIAEGSPIAVTKAILQEDRKEPALEEVFLKVASWKDKGSTDEAA